MHLVELRQHVLGREVDLIGASAAQILVACARVGHTLTDILSHNSFFSDRKLREATGFVPRISLRDGMKRVIAELDAAGRLPRVEPGGWEDRVIEQLTGRHV